MKRLITVLLCAGLLAALCPVTAFAAPDTKEVVFGSCTAQIPADWRENDPYYYKDANDAIPMLYFLEVNDFSTLDEVKESADRFIDALSQAMESPVTVLPMHETTYGDYDALTFSVYGTIEDYDLIMQTDVFEEPTGNLLVIVYCYDDDNRDYVDILENMVIQ